MRSSYILLGVSTDQLKIGRLVTDIWAPYNRYHDPPSISSSPEIHELNLHKSHLYYRTGTKSTVLVKLSKLFGINHDSQSNVCLDIEAESTSTQTLSNYPEVFKSLWENTTDETDGTKEWIQHRLLDDEDVYMVVGIRTVTNATVTVSNFSGNATGLNAGIPVSELASHGLYGSSALDVMIAMSAGQVKGVGETYQIKGACVIAAQYCKVKVGKWWNGDSKEAHLTTRDVAWEWLVGNHSRQPGHSDGFPQDRPVVTVSLGEPLDAAKFIGVNEEVVSETDDDDDDRIRSFTMHDVELVF
jgi:hypothetical protein